MRGVWPRQHGRLGWGRLLGGAIEQPPGDGEAEEHERPAIEWSVMSNPRYFRAKRATVRGCSEGSMTSAWASATRECGAEPSMAMDTWLFRLTFATLRLEGELATQMLSWSCTNQTGTVWGELSGCTDENQAVCARSSRSSRSLCIGLGTSVMSCLTGSASGRWLDGRGVRRERTARQV